MNFIPPPFRQMPARRPYKWVRSAFFALTAVDRRLESRKNLLALYRHDYPSYHYRLSREFAKALVDEHKHHKTLLLFAENRLRKIRQRVNKL